VSSVPEPPSKRVEITISARTMATILGVAAFVWAFIAARQAVLWVFIALFLAIVLSMPVTWLEQRAGMKRGNAAMLVVLGLFGVIALLAYLLVSPFVGAVRNLIEDLPDIVERIRGSDLFLEIDRRTDVGTKLQERADSLAGDLPSKLGEAFSFGGKVFGFGLGAVTIVFMTLFLVIDLPNLSRSLHTVLFPRDSSRVAMLEERITRTIGRYALGAVAIAAIAGTVQGTAAWLLGVPFALALGIIAGLLGLIPQIGATLAAVILSLVALTVGWPQALVMLAVCIGYQQVENYVLQPTIQGRAAEISGFFVIASVVIGAALLGVVGALIAVPLTASAQIVIRELTAERRAAVALAHAATPPAGGAEPPAEAEES
jgi:predicted PurR-regulated permease PerM